MVDFPVLNSKRLGERIKNDVPRLFLICDIFIASGRGTRGQKIFVLRVGGRGFF